MDSTSYGRVNLWMAMFASMTILVLANSDHNLFDLAETWYDLLPFYVKIGAGYCTNSVGDPYNIISDVSIPENYSDLAKSQFCGSHCISENSAHVGFQIYQQPSTLYSRCHCLKGDGQVSNSIDYGTGENFLHCFKYVLPSIQHFDFVGAGVCLSEEFDHYDRLVHFDVDSVEDCRDICQKINSTNLAGFTYQAQIHGGECDCLFPDERVPSLPIDVDYAFYGGIGANSIAGVSIDSPGIHCYSYVEDSYVDKDEGRCVDGSGFMFDYISYNLIQTLDDCKAKCLSDSSYYLGLEYPGCRCLYSEGKVPSQPLTDANHGDFGFSAKGRVFGSDGNFQVACFSNNDFERWYDIPPLYVALGKGYCENSFGRAFTVYADYKIPEDERSSEIHVARYCVQQCDTSFPNHVGFQVVDPQLNQEPHCECLTSFDEILSATNDGSGKYLQCFKYVPHAMEEFEFVGAGYCRDIQENTYDAIVHFNVASEDNCRGICLELQSTNLAGLSYRSDYLECNCLFADDQIPFQPDGATSASYTSYGTGRIAGTYYNGGSEEHCYSYEDQSYKDIGLGNCVDSFGYPYDNILYNGVRSTEDCKNRCGSNSTDYMGFEYDFMYEYCLCLYNDGNVPSQPTTDASYSYFYGYARGAISHSDGSPESMGCYSYGEYVAKRWYDVPSFYFAIGSGYCANSEGKGYESDGDFLIPEHEQISETKMASYCSQQCEYSAPDRVGFQVRQHQSSQEIHCQCLVGIDELSRTVVDGSEAEYLQCFKYIPPPVIQGFHFVGVGNCMDVDNNFYDRLEYNSMLLSVEDCRDICLQLNYTNLAGLSYVSASGQCFCLFEDGHIPFQPDGALGAYYINDGVGAIARTNSIGGSRCYSFDGHSYTDEGVGNCVDATGSMYDYIYFPSKESLEECIEVCATNSTDYLGLELAIEYENCFCLYDDGKVPSQPPNAPYSSYFGGTAQGDISHAYDYGSDSMACYSYNGEEKTTTTTTSTITTTTTSTSTTTTTSLQSSPRILVLITGSADLLNSYVPGPEQEKEKFFLVFSQTVEVVVSEIMRPDQSLFSVDVISINYQTARRTRILRGFARDLHRRLGKLTIEYKVSVEEICETGGCENSDEAASSLHSQITNALSEEIESNDFDKYLQSNAAKANVPSLFNATIDSFDFGSAEVTILGELANFYPRLQGSDKGCINDGNAPNYMKNNPGFWISTLKYCCSTFFGSNYMSCMGEPQVALPYVWYPDYLNQYCIQDCSDSPTYYGGGDDVFYDSSTACCDGSLWWVSRNVCEDDSQEHIKMECVKWYVDWDQLICVMDCVGDAPCGGLAFPEQELYDNKTICCMEELSWNGECLSS